MKQNVHSETAYTFSCSIRYEISSVHTFGHYFLRLILIWSNHLRLGPWRELYQSGFPAKVCVVGLFRLSHTCYMASPSPPRFDHSNRRNVGPAIYEVSHYVVSSILVLLPLPEVQVTWSIFLGTLFWKTLRLCSSLRARDQASNLYKQRVQIQVCVF